MYDAIIIGAGLSGLQAASTLDHEGLRYLVLEARDRVGGKTFSLRDPATGAVKSELGAAWINDSNQGRMWQLAQDLGLHTYVQNTTGDVVVQDLDGSLVKFPYGEVPKVGFLYTPLLHVSPGYCLVLGFGLQSSCIQCMHC
jgi:monoamine oxidase